MNHDTISKIAKLVIIINLCIICAAIGYFASPFLFSKISDNSSQKSTPETTTTAAPTAVPTVIPTTTPTFIPTSIPTPIPAEAATSEETASGQTVENDNAVKVIDQAAVVSQENNYSVDGITYIADVYEYLTLRNAPSTSAPAICLLPPFTEMYITEFTNSTMVHIVTVGTNYIGYVNKNYLAMKDTVTLRAGKNSPQAASSSDPIYYADVYDYLTLRNAASTSAGELDRLLPFTAMRVHNWTNGMAYVTVLDTNQQGYVNADYITSNPNNTKRAGKTSVSMTEHGFSVGNYCFADVEEYLTLRNAPNTSAGELARLPDDTMMVILEITNEKMMKVNVVGTNQVGYVNRNFVK